MNNKKKRIFDIIQIGYAGDVASRTSFKNGETLIKSGDIVFVFSKRYMADAQTISV